MRFKPPLLTVFVLFLFVQGGLYSCMQKGQKGAGANPPPPRNEATAEEAAKISDTLSEIENMMAEMGQPKSFRSIPIILVSSENTSVTDRPAACISYNGKPQFIVLKRRVLEEDSRTDILQTEATAFKVLLHEIGHCYFHRSHDATVLQREGQWIRLSFSEKQWGMVSIPYDSLGASIMTPDSLVLPIPLKRYYVAEMLGLERAKDVMELAKYVQIDLERIQNQ